MRQLTVCLFVLALTACASGPAPRTGFLSDYSQLQPVGRGDNLLEQRPPAGFSAAAYRAVMIDPTVVSIDGLSSQDRAALANVFREALIERVEGRLPIVQRPGPGVIRVRSSIVSVRKASVPLNVVTSALLGPISRGGVAAEAEVLDGGSGQRIAALSWSRRGASLVKPGLSYTQLGEAREGLRAFAARLAGLFVEERR